MTTSLLRALWRDLFMGEGGRGEDGQCFSIKSLYNCKTIKIVEIVKAVETVKVVKIANINKIYHTATLLSMRAALILCFKC